MGILRWLADGVPTLVLAVDVRRKLWQYLFRKKKHRMNELTSAQKIIFVRIQVWQMCMCCTVDSLNAT